MEKYANNQIRLARIKAYLWQINAGRVMQIVEDMPAIQQAKNRVMQFTSEAKSGMYSGVAWVMIYLLIIGVACAAR